MTNQTITKTIMLTGVCPKTLKVTYEKDTLKVVDIKFRGGCQGNAEGLRKLVTGKTLEELTTLLAGIPCGFKDSSCPNELSKACKTILEEVDKGENC